MITDSEDILTEILLSLPAKSVIRFKLVSKRWLCLISSHHFSHLHSTRHRLSKPEPLLLLRLSQMSHRHYYLQSNLSKLVSYNFPSALEDLFVCSFSSGLFLLRCSSAPQDCHVYNPTTKQSRNVTLSTNEMYPIVVGLNIIVFDTLKSPYYKIICVRFARKRTSGSFRCMSRPRRCQIEVYESDTSTWKLLGDPFLAPSNMDFDRGIYWNNGIHWDGIFFDFDKNAVQEHPEFLVPDDDGRTTFDVNYIGWNGCLYCITHDPEKKLVAVFELQRDYSQWLLKHRIDLGPDFGPLSILSMVGGYGEDDSALLIRKPGKITAYRFAEKSFKEIIDFEETFYEENCAEFVSGFTFQFFETLFLV